MQECVKGRYLTTYWYDWIFAEVGTVPGRPEGLALMDAKRNALYVPDVWIED